MRRTACIVFAFCAPAAHAHHGFGTFEPYSGADIVHPSNVPYQPDSCDDRSVR